jgi:hypothetical protein
MFMLSKQKSSTSPRIVKGNLGAAPQGSSILTNRPSG